jgi:hypothetical protein
MHTEFWSENLKGGDRLEDVGMAGRMILDWIPNKQFGRVWAGFTRLRIGISDGLL